MYTRAIYLENAGWLRKLRDNAVKEKRWLEAYLLTFFRIELGLILLIDYNMTTTGKIRYSEKFYERITEGNLRFNELINLFCLLYGDELFQALKTVQKERNQFVHEFYKKKKIHFQKYVEDLYINAILVENELAGIVQREVGKSRD